MKNMKDDRSRAGGFPYQKHIRDIESRILVSVMV